MLCKLNLCCCFFFNILMRVNKYTYEYLNLSVRAVHISFNSTHESYIKFELQLLLLLFCVKKKSQITQIHIVFHK